MNRIKALKNLAFEKNGFEAFLITNESNLFYFCGTRGMACLLVTRTDDDTIHVYSTNYEQVKTEAKGFNVELMKSGEKLTEKIAVELKESKAQTLAVDAMSFEFYRALSRTLRRKAKIKLQSEPVWQLRKVKDDEELELMKRAGELTGLGMKVACETIRSGVIEYEVAAEAEYAMRRKGSSGTAFETIVASGQRSTFPHGGCTDRKIRNGDLVVVDIGAEYNSYRSDMTRTIVAGKPSQKQERVYKIVKQAQQEAYEATRPKAKTSDIDSLARKVIRDAGYGEYFVHGLGHGVGLDVHEPPGLGPESKEQLVAGNVVTIEPGIYISGFGGIRIEDTVLVQPRKAEKFTIGPYTLRT